MGLTQRLGTIPLAIQTDSSNNVGIGGAANASYKLAVTGASLFTSGITATANTSGAFAGLTLANSGTGSAQVFFNNSAQSWIVNLRTDNHFSIFNNTASTTPFFINTNGNVGIGSTNPVGTLEIFKSSTPYLRIIDGTRYVNIGVDGTSVFYNTNSSHRFYVQDGTITALTISSSGAVGIGTSSPSNKLDVRNAGDFDVKFRSEAAGGTVGLLLETANTFSGTSQAFIKVIGAAGNGTSQLIFGTAGASGDSTATERMRITSGGSVCINSTSPLNANAKLNINGELWMGNMTAGAGNSTLKYNTGTGLVTFDSSARIFKKDITDLEYGLDAVLKMSSKKYKWKSNNQEDLGFIADEMYKVVPEVVYLADSSINETELEDGEPMGINYDRLVPVLVKAIQELNAKVTALENK